MGGQFDVPSADHPKRAAPEMLQIAQATLTSVELGEPVDTLIVATKALYQSRIGTFADHYDQRLGLQRGLP